MSHSKTSNIVKPSLLVEAPGIRLKSWALPTFVCQRIPSDRVHTSVSCINVIDYR